MWSYRTSRAYMITSIAMTADRTESVGCQARTLATLRDTLLPKLLSGELRMANVRN